MSEASWSLPDETVLRQELHAYRLELRKTRRRLDEAYSLISSISENATEGILVTNAQTVIQSVNPALERATGYKASEMIGRTPALFRSKQHDNDFYGEMWRSLHEHGQWRGEVLNRHKNGEVYPEYLAISAVKDAEQQVSHYVGIYSDFHTKEYILERMHYLANYDGLTGLPNRRLFLDRLNVSLSHARRDRHMLAVMFVDLDRFKQVNDTLGHKVGDGLLLAVSERLRNCLREVDTFARLGGDEFTALLPALKHPDDALNVARKFLDCCTQPVTVEGHELRFTVSIGIGIYPADGEDAESLLHNADIAMYRIKEAGRNGYVRYSEEMIVCRLPDTGIAEDWLPTGK
jgi:diguanylate cyclase (GGDEF)-like protein/PAS domain S-box-containing protein